MSKIHFFTYCYFFKEMGNKAEMHINVKSNNIKFNPKFMFYSFTVHLTIVKIHDLCLCIYFISI